MSLRQDKLSLLLIAPLLMVSTLLLTGCGRPDRANIALRMQIQEMESQMADLERQRQANLATIRALQAQRETIATLPEDRLDQLFTTHGLRIGRLTGGADFDPSMPGDDGLQVHAVPLDQRGDLLKAAGWFIIDAFDLSLPQDNHLGRWEFTPEEAARHWYGALMTYGYAFNVTWQRPPQSERITVRVTFRDALTGREFTEQREVTVNPPAPDAALAAPTTAPAVPR